MCSKEYQVVAMLLLYVGLFQVVARGLLCVFRVIERLLLCGSSGVFLPLTVCFHSNPPDVPSKFSRRRSKLDMTDQTEGVNDSGNHSNIYGITGTKTDRLTSFHQFPVYVVVHTSFCCLIIITCK